MAALYSFIILALPPDSTGQRRVRCMFQPSMAHRIEFDLRQPSSETNLKYIPALHFGVSANTGFSTQKLFLLSSAKIEDPKRDPEKNGQQMLAAWEFAVGRLHQPSQVTCSLASIDHTAISEGVGRDVQRPTLQKEYSQSKARQKEKRNVDRTQTSCISQVVILKGHKKPTICKGNLEIAV